MPKEITPEMVECIEDFLQDDGKAYFLKELLTHDTLVHCHIMGGGMQVRNKLRDSGLCEDWNDHDYDNNWINIVMKAIAQDQTTEKAFIQDETPEDELIT